MLKFNLQFKFHLYLWTNKSQEIKKDIVEFVLFKINSQIPNLIIVTFRIQVNQFIKKHNMGCNPRNYVHGVYLTIN